MMAQLAAYTGWAKTRATQGPSSLMIGVGRVPAICIARDILKMIFPRSFHRTACRGLEARFSRLRSVGRQIIETWSGVSRREALAHQG
jgi:hypothetical protein